jgi:hypothetical protein
MSSPTSILHTPGASRLRAFIWPREQCLRSSKSYFRAGSRALTPGRLAFNTNHPSRGIHFSSAMSSPPYLQGWISPWLRDGGEQISGSGTVAHRSEPGDGLVFRRLPSKERRPDTYEALGETMDGFGVAVSRKGEYHFRLLLGSSKPRGWLQCFHEGAR